jgi:diamine N-acetyltransferase
MIELRAIDKGNYDECLSLKVSDEQRNFVASNIYSLAQAWVYYETAYPFAIYADGVMVGFVMMGYHTEKNIYNIWRFMIDSRYQKRGYGKIAVQLSIEYLRKEFNVSEVFLSFQPKNMAAEKLYSSLGFKRTGEVENGEVVMRLDIKNKG